MGKMLLLNNVFKWLYPLLLIFLIGCTSIIPRDIQDYTSPEKIDKEDSTPKTVVVMPFDNETDENGIEILVRKSFYNHFSSKNYRDLELAAIDRGLTIFVEKPPSSWRDLSPSSIGEFFHADYIIYGRVRELKKIFLGIYSQIILKLEIEMVDCKNGNLILGKTVIKRSHEGGLPFSLFGIIPAALRSGLHMKEEKTIELVERANRELVRQIPELPAPPFIPYFIEIQVASFLDPERAQQTMKEFQGRGYNPRIETVKIENRIWHRILLGPYYNFPEAEKVRDRIVRNYHFKPIFIHRYPEIPGKNHSKNGSGSPQ